MNIETPEAKQIESINNSFSHLKLEIGLHPDQNNPFSPKDTWNKQVFDRLREYNPRVIALDGSMPSGRTDIFSGLSTLHIDPENVVLNNPGLVNTSDKLISFVMGDCASVEYPLRTNGFSDLYTDKVVQVENTYQSGNNKELSTKNTASAALGLLLYFAANKSAEILMKNSLNHLQFSEAVRSNNKSQELQRRR